MKIIDNETPIKDIPHEAHTKNIPEETKVAISPEEYTKFYETVILAGQKYIKTFSVRESPLKFHTRTSLESDTIIEKVLAKQKEDPITGAKLMNDLNLAYSLHSFAGVDYYKMPIEQRLALLDEFPMPKKSLFLTYLGKFETHISELVKEFENF